jgi:hypothetical protein
MRRLMRRLSGLPTRPRPPAAPSRAPGGPGARPPPGPGTSSRPVAAPSLPGSLPRPAAARLGPGRAWGARDPRLGACPAAAGPHWQLETASHWQASLKLTVTVASRGRAWLPQRAQRRAPASGGQGLIAECILTPTVRDSHQRTHRVAPSRPKCAFAHRRLLP